MSFQNGGALGQQYMAVSYPQQNMMYVPAQMPQQTIFRQPPPIQQMPIQQTYPLIVGRQVNTLEEIRPNEVPNDGSYAVFPSGDLSCVYIKYFTSSGTIETLRFVPETPAVTAADAVPQTDILAPVNERLDRIEKKLSKLSYYRKPYKKEDADGDERTE